MSDLNTCPYQMNGNWISFSNQVSATGLDRSLKSYSRKTMFLDFNPKFGYVFKFTLRKINALSLTRVPPGAHPWGMTGHEYWFETCFDRMGKKVCWWKGSMISQPVKVRRVFTSSGEKHSVEKRCPGAALGENSHLWLTFLYHCMGSTFAIVWSVKFSAENDRRRTKTHWLSDPLWKKYFLTMAGAPPEWTRGSTSQIAPNLRIVS